MKKAQGSWREGMKAPERGEAGREERGQMELACAYHKWKLWIDGRCQEGIRNDMGQQRLSEKRHGCIRGEE